MVMSYKVAFLYISYWQVTTFFFRFTLLKDDDEAKTFENRFPEILHEGRTISTEVDFGHPRHDQFELEIKVDIAIYRYI